MSCSWLENNTDVVMDAVLGVISPDHELWRHLEQCDACREEFMGYHAVVDALKALPWDTPPRLIYLMDHESRLPRWSRRVVLAAASILTALALGFASGTFYFTQRQMKMSEHRSVTAVEAQYRQVCDAAVREQLASFEMRFMKKYERVLQDVVARLDSQEASLTQVHNELLDLQQRHDMLVQDTRSQIQSLLRVVNAGGQ